jgi:hypothetical protein
MPASPSILRSLPFERAENGEAKFLTATSKGIDGRPRMPVLIPASDGAGKSLLDYAAFVLDQEARYCQQ